MDGNLFNTDEMEALLGQINAAKIESAGQEMEQEADMSEEMKASQRRYEEILKKHAKDND